MFLNQINFVNKEAPALQIKPFVPLNIGALSILHDTEINVIGFCCVWPPFTNMV